jgi:hypothetical protein
MRRAHSSAATYTLSAMSPDDGPSLSLLSSAGAVGTQPRSRSSIGFRSAPRHGGHDHHPSSRAGIIGGTTASSAWPSSLSSNSSSMISGGTIGTHRRSGSGGTPLGGRERRVSIEHPATGVTNSPALTSTNGVTGTSPQPPNGTLPLRALSPLLVGSEDRRAAIWGVPSSSGATATRSKPSSASSNNNPSNSMMISPDLPLSSGAARRLSSPVLNGNGIWGYDDEADDHSITMVSNSGTAASAQHRAVIAAREIYDDNEPRANSSSSGSSSDHTLSPHLTGHPGTIHTGEINDDVDDSFLASHYGKEAARAARSSSLTTYDNMSRSSAASTTMNNYIVPPRSTSAASVLPHTPGGTLINNRPSAVSIWHTTPTGGRSASPTPASADRHERIPSRPGSSIGMNDLRRERTGGDMLDSIDNSANNTRAPSPTQLATSISMPATNTPLTIVSNDGSDRRMIRAALSPRPNVLRQSAVSGNVSAALDSDMGFLPSRSNASPPTNTRSLSNGVGSSPLSMNRSTSGSVGGGGGRNTPGVKPSGSSTSTPAVVASSRSGSPPPSRNTSSPLPGSGRPPSASGHRATGTSAGSLRRPPSAEGHHSSSGIGMDGPDREYTPYTPMGTGVSVHARPPGKDFGSDREKLPPRAASHASVFTPHNPRLAPLFVPSNNTNTNSNSNSTSSDPSSYTQERSPSPQPPLQQHQQSAVAAVTQQSATLPSLQALAPFYDVSTTSLSLLAPILRRDLDDEGCPVCLRGSMGPPPRSATPTMGYNERDQYDTTSIVVMRCKRLGCQHVAHLRCIADPDGMGLRRMQRSHPTSFFKALPLPLPDLDLSFSEEGTRRGCSFELLLLHMTSDVVIARYQSQQGQLVDSLVNVHNGMEYLLLPVLVSAVKAAQHSNVSVPSFNVQRGRMIFRGVSQHTAEQWHYQANYDLSASALASISDSNSIIRASPSTVSLVLVDGTQGSTLTVEITRATSRSSSPQDGFRRTPSSGGSSNNDDINWIVSKIRLEMSPLPPSAAPVVPPSVPTTLITTDSYRSDSYPMANNLRSPPVAGRTSSGGRLPVTGTNVVPATVVTPVGATPPPVVYLVLGPDGQYTQMVAPPPAILTTRASSTDSDHSRGSSPPRSGRSTRHHDNYHHNNRDRERDHHDGSDDDNDDPYHDYAGHPRHMGPPITSSRTAPSRVPVLPGAPPRQQQQPQQVILPNIARPASVSSVITIDGSNTTSGSNTPSNISTGTSGGSKESTSGGGRMPFTPPGLLLGEGGVAALEGLGTTGITGHIVALAKSQAGSRFLQGKLTDGDMAYYSLVFTESLDTLPELMVDLFGNYLCQKLIAGANASQRLQMLSKLQHHLVAISCDRQGTRAVQKLVEVASTPQEVQLILESLCALPDPKESPSAPATSVATTSTTITTSAPAAATDSTSSEPSSTSASSSVSGDSTTSIEVKEPVAENKDALVAAPSTVGESSSTISSISSVSDTSVVSSTIVSSSSSTASSSSSISVLTPSAPSTSASVAISSGMPLRDGGVKLLQLIRDPNGSHVIHALLDHFTSDRLDYVIDVAFGAVRQLGVDQHGLCVLKKCITLVTTEVFTRFAMRVLEHVLEFVDNQYGNYLVQHIIERTNHVPGAVSESDATLYYQCNQSLHRGLSNHYARLSRQKFSSNVVEKCLRLNDRRVRSLIINELMSEETISSLLQDSYGNYVMQNVLSVADRDQAGILIGRIRPDLHSLRKNIRKKWERLLANSIAAGATPGPPPASTAASTTSSSPSTTTTITPNTSGTFSSSASPSTTIISPGGGVHGSFDPSFERSTSIGSSLSSSSPLSSLSQPSSPYMSIGVSPSSSGGGSGGDRRRGNHHNNSSGGRSDNRRGGDRGDRDHRDHNYRDQPQSQHHRSDHRDQRMSGGSSGYHHNSSSSGGGGGGMMHHVSPQALPQHQQVHRVSGGMGGSRHGHHGGGGGGGDRRHGGGSSSSSRHDHRSHGSGSGRSQGSSSSSNYHHSAIAAATGTPYYQSHPGHASAHISAHSQQQHHVAVSPVTIPTHVPFYQTAPTVGPSSYAVAPSSHTQQHHGQHHSQHHPNDYGGYHQF